MEGDNDLTKICLTLTFTLAIITISKIHFTKGQKVPTLKSTKKIQHS